MLKLALVFLLVGIVAGFIGFTGGASFVIAKFFAFLFLVLFLLFLGLALTAMQRLDSLAKNGHFPTRRGKARA